MPRRGNFLLAARRRAVKKYGGRIAGFRTTRGALRALTSRRKKMSHRGRRVGGMRRKRSRGRFRTRRHGVRRRRHFKKGGTFTWTVSTRLTPVSPGGITSLNTLGVPYTGPMTSDGCVPAGYVAEQVSTGVLGSYNMDFSRLVVANCPVNLGYYEYVKCHGGGMSFRRIDSGGNAGIMFSLSPGPTVALEEFVPFNWGTRVYPLRMYYRFLSSIETTTADYSNIQVFLADKRTRTRWIKPGRKVTFRFRPTARVDRVMTNVERAYNAADPYTGTTETDVTRKLFIPGKAHKLGWLPTGLVCNPENTFTDQFSSPLPGSNTGINPGLPNIFHILGATVLIMFDYDQQGAFTYNVPGTTAPTTIQYAPLQYPLIVRREWARYSVRGIRFENTLQPSIIPAVQQYPISNPAFTTPFTERCNFPWIQTVPIPPLNQDTAIGPLSATVPKTYAVNCAFGPLRSGGLAPPS